jgi:hypothetical protein
MATAATAVMTLFAAAGTARAGVYTDDMTKCLVKAMSPQDQSTLIQWTFSAMALHPDVHPYANITDEQRKALDQKAANLFQRMMTVDCRKEVVDAVKYEGTGSFEDAFAAMGEAAMRGLMNEPQVSKGMEGFVEYFDKTRMEALFKDSRSTGGAPPSP